MNFFKKILLATLIVFIGIQFIRPAHNQNGQVSNADVVKIYNIPVGVENVLKTACYDCHSNNTRYPWYVNIQPVGWMMANHIRNGKENLNFSEFGAYSERKQTNKLRAIATSIKEGSMPLWSYTVIHTKAKLSEKNKNLITEWATKTRDSISLKN